MSIDVHFECKRHEYEETLKAVGIQPGWTVLDAGCGGGGFLPLMSELVGESGHIKALDLAPENINTFTGVLGGDWSSEKCR